MVCVFAHLHTEPSERHEVFPCMQHRLGGGSFRALESPAVLPHLGYSGLPFTVVMQLHVRGSWSMEKPFMKPLLRLCIQYLGCFCRPPLFQTSTSILAPSSGVATILNRGCCSRPLRCRLWCLQSLAPVYCVSPCCIPLTHALRKLLFWTIPDLLAVVPPYCGS